MGKKRANKRDRECTEDGNVIASTASPSDEPPRKRRLSDKDKDDAVNEEMRRRREQEAQLRIAFRVAEGGKGGGLNDRQNPADRRTYEDKSGYDEFGRRIKSSDPADLPSHCL